jgi:hypothetical protein
MKKLTLSIISLLFLFNCFPSKKANMLEPEAIKSIFIGCFGFAFS